VTSTVQRDLSGLVFLRREALADGYTDRAIKRMVDSGQWHRIRAGAYVATETWRTLNAADRHRLTARAVLRTSHPSTVLSHTSAALEHGAPVWGLDLAEVHVTRTDGKPRRREAGVVHHRGKLGDDQVVQLDDVPVTDLLRTAVEVTTLGRVEAALVTVDGLLRLAMPDGDALERMRHRARYWPHSLTSEVVFRLADPRRESAAESRAAYFFWNQGLPRPEPQVVIEDERGREFARVDFAWPELGVFLEIDGREKYWRYRREDESLEDYLMREKRRAEHICMLTGWVCIRISWSDLDTPRATATRIRRILESKRPAM
jgi:hypothetical protein